MCDVFDVPRQEEDILPEFPFEIVRLPHIIDYRDVVIGTCFADLGNYLNPEWRSVVNLQENKITGVLLPKDIMFMVGDNNPLVLYCVEGIFGYPHIDVPIWAIAHEMHLRAGRNPIDTLNLYSSNWMSAFLIESFGEDVKTEVYKLLMNDKKFFDFDGIKIGGTLSISRESRDGAPINFCTLFFNYDESDGTSYDKKISIVVEKVRRSLSEEFGEELCLSLCINGYYSEI